MTTGIRTTLICPLLALAATTAQAVTYYVSPTGGDTPPYTNWAMAATNVQDAVNVADNGDTVLVAPGNYLLASEILITNGITLESVAGAKETIISGGGATRCIHVTDSNTVIRGFTICDGFVSWGSGWWPGGGGICIQASPVLTEMCIIRNNRAEGYGTSGAFAQGGGVYGGIIRNCLVVSNYVLAVASGKSAPETALGGGVALAALVENCTVVANTVDARNWGGPPSEMGGGIYGGEVANCIVYGNVGGDDCHSCSRIDYTRTTPEQSGIGNITNDPQFIGTGDYRLGSSSPCVNAGTNQAWMAGATDLNGFPRIIGDRVDMGCYETASTNLIPPGIIAPIAIPSGGTETYVTSNSFIWVEGAKQSQTWVIVDLGLNSTGAVQTWSGTTWSNLLTIDEDVVDDTRYRCANSNFTDVSANETRINYTRNGTGTPEVSVTTPDTCVFDEIAFYTIEGTYNRHMFSPLMISNAADSTVFELSVPTAVDGDWSARVPLSHGANSFFVTGTNIYGDAATGTVTITRASTGVVHYVSVSSTNPIPPYTNWATASSDIQSAVEAANDGDTVLVTNGTYFTGYHGIEPFGDVIVITNRISLISANGADATTIQTATSDEDILFVRGLLIHHEGAVISGFTVSGGRGHTEGGGIYVSGGTVLRCQISGNSADRTGGGIAGNGLIENCVISGNSVGPDPDYFPAYGGGVYGCTLHNCLVINNATSARDKPSGNQSCGGGASDSVLLNCTVAGNVASWSHLPISIGGGGTWNCSLQNTIVFSNSPNDIENSDANIVACWTNDPLWMGDGLYRLASNSPCINAGTNLPWSSFDHDIDGFPRLVGPSVDIGAYEATGKKLTIEANPSDAGTCYPSGYGLYAFPVPSVLTNIAVSPQLLISWWPIDYPSRYVCTGWTGSGSVPASGSNTWISFTLNEDSTLTWQWLLEHRADFVSAHGSITGAIAGFYPANTMLYLYPRPDPGCQFYQWVVDGSPGYVGTSIPVNVLMDQPKTISAVFTTNLQLAVDGTPSQFDAPAPLDYGVHWMSADTIITNSVNSPANESNGTRYVCAGWTGTGDVPPTGSTDSVSFTLTTNSTLTWNWEPEYQLTLLPSSNGSMTGASAGYKTNNSVFSLFPVPDMGYILSYWITNGSVGDSAAPLNVTMDEPKSIQAIFASPYLKSWADSDADKYMDRWEMRAGKNPTNAFEHPHDAVINDYNGDAASDLAAYALSSGNWFIRSVDGSKLITFSQNWGGAGLVPISGDYDKDGVCDLAVYELATGNWYIRSLGFATPISFGQNWGGAGLIPVWGDYNGDKMFDLAVYQESTGNWYIRSLGPVGPGNPPICFGQNWGGAGLIPVAGDFNGDGIYDLAVYQQATGNWYIRSLGPGAPITFGQNWGGAGLVPVSGDFNRDGVFDLAVYDEATKKWYIRPLGAAPPLTFGQEWGSLPAASVYAVPGDYNGDWTNDPMYDMAIFCQTNGSWKIRRLGGGQKAVIANGANWGNAATIPVGHTE